MSNSYLITFNGKSKGEVLLEYNDSGLLTKCVIDIDRAIAHKYFLTNFPARLPELQKYQAAKVPGMRVTKIMADLSFTAFWNAYAHKVGNKSRAEKLWNALPEEKRAKALNYISRYNQFLMLNPGIQRLYPETYLSQKRYDNE